MEFTEFFEQEEGTGVLRENWHPITDHEAEWALMKIQEAQAQVAHHEAERDAAMARWERYVEQMTRDSQRTIAFFEAKLHGYLLSLIETGKTGKKKSYQLPSARLQLRHVEARWEPNDKAALQNYAEAVDAVKVTVEPDMARVRELCAEGVDVPGMVLVRQSGESFSVVFLNERKDGEA